MTMGDLLTDLELCQVAGVGPESRGNIGELQNVLANADIYYWWKADGSIGFHLAPCTCCRNSKAI